MQRKFRSALILLPFICLLTMSQTTPGIYEQCGGEGWTGPTVCGPGLICQVVTPAYSQCRMGGNPGTTKYQKLNYTGSCTRNVSVLTTTYYSGSTVVATTVTRNGVTTGNTPPSWMYTSSTATTSVSQEPYTGTGNTCTVGGTLDSCTPKTPCG